MTLALAARSAAILICVCIQATVTQSTVAWAGEFDDLEVVQVFKHPDPNKKNMMIEIRKKADPPAPDFKAASPADNSSFEGFFWGHPDTGFYKQNARYEHGSSRPMEMVYSILEPTADFRERTAEFRVRSKTPAQGQTGPITDWESNLEISCVGKQSCLLGTHREIETINHKIHTGETPLIGSMNATRILFILKNKDTEEFIIIETERFRESGNKMEILRGRAGQFQWSGIKHWIDRRTSDILILENKGEWLTIPKRLPRHTLAELSRSADPNRTPLQVVYRFDMDESTLLKSWIHFLHLPEARYGIYNYHSVCSDLWGMN